MSGPEKISFREYARRLGCSEGAVRKAIQAGKIVEGVTDLDKPRPKIIPDVANAEWGKHYNPEYQKGSALAAQFNESEPEPTPVNKPEPTPQPAPVPRQVQPPTPSPIPGSGKSLAELKRLREEVRLQKDALELREQKGQLVDKDKVYRSLFEAGQEIRTALLAVPDRIIDEILAAPSRNEAHTVLYRALAGVLENFADISKRNLTN